MTQLSPCTEQFKEAEPCRCDNCGHEAHLSALDAITDAQERLTPGEETPAGQCPACGALAYLASPPEWVMAARAAKEVL